MRVWRIDIVGMLFAAVAVAATGHAAADVPVPAPKSVNGERCVEPTDVMRRYHMEMLLHQRDDTVIRGIRTDRHSLVGCIGCHADSDAGGAPIPVNAEGQFCSTCHEYAAVEMDCFQCHAAVPAEPRPAGDSVDAMPTVPATVSHGRANSPAGGS